MNAMVKNKLLLAAIGLAIASLFWLVPLVLRGIRDADAAKRQNNDLIRAEIEDQYNIAGQINIIKTKGTTTVALASSTLELELPILMYHHIRDYNKPKDPIGMKLSVSPKNFSAQLDEISKLGYQTIDFKDLERGDIPPKPIIITFDDGYNDFYSNAYPEISKRKMKAVAFIITGYIGAPAYMTANEIKEMNKNGIEIGSHTVTHPGLAFLKNEKQKQEVDDSKTALQKIISENIVSFCYPYGSFNDATLKYVEEAGYKYAVTTKTGEADTNGPFLMKRVRVPDKANIKNLLKAMRNAPNKNPR